MDGFATTLDVPVELDAATAPALARSVKQAYDDGAQLVSLDFTGNTFCDSSGIKLMVNALKHATALGRGLVVLNPPRMLRRMGEVLGISGLLGLPPA